MADDHAQAQRVIRQVDLPTTEQLAQLGSEHEATMRVAQEAYSTLRTVQIDLPSFLSGVARSLDLGATFSRDYESLRAHEVDMQALVADWASVSGSLAEAITTFREAQPEDTRKLLDDLQEAARERVAR